MSQNQHDMAERLRAAREMHGGYSAPTDAARAMGVEPPTYLGHENGSRGFKSSAAQYADFYRVNLEWLLMGRGPMKKAEASADKRGSNDGVTNPDINIASLPRDLPIVGAAACGSDGMFELNGQTQDHARRPPRLAGVKDAYAVWIMGESMFPWRKNGGLVVVHPHQPVNIGDYVVVQLRPDRDGDPIRAYIKQLVRRTARELRLRQYRPDEELTITMSKVMTIHRIVDWDEAMGL